MNGLTPGAAALAREYAVEHERARSVGGVMAVMMLWRDQAVTGVRDERYPRDMNPRTLGVPLPEACRPPKLVSVLNRPPGVKLEGSAFGVAAFMERARKEAGGRPPPKPCKYDRICQEWQAAERLRIERESSSSVAPVEPGLGSTSVVEENAVEIENARETSARSGEVSSGSTVVPASIAQVGLYGAVRGIELEIDEAVSLPRYVSFGSELHRDDPGGGCLPPPYGHDVVLSMAALPRGREFVGLGHVHVDRKPPDIVQTASRSFLSALFSAPDDDRQWRSFACKLGWSFKRMKFKMDVPEDLVVAVFRSHAVELVADLLGGDVVGKSVKVVTLAEAARIRYKDLWVVMDDWPDGPIRYGEKGNVVVYKARHAMVWSCELGCGALAR